MIPSLSQGCPTQGLKPYNPCDQIWQLCLFLSPPWKDALEEATIKLKDVYFFVEHQSKGSGTTNKHNRESPWSYAVRENMTCPPALLIWAQEFQTYSLFSPLLNFFPLVAANLSSHCLQNNPLNEEGKCFV